MSSDNTEGFQELSTEHVEFMKTIFSFHERSIEKLQDFKTILIGLNKKRNIQTKCFFIENTHNEKTDISYLKSVQNLINNFYLKN